MVTHGNEPGNEPGATGRERSPAGAPIAGAPIAGAPIAGADWGMKVAIAILAVAFVAYAWAAQRLQRDEWAAREKDRIETRARLDRNLETIKADAAANRKALIWIKERLENGQSQ